LNHGPLAVACGFVAVTLATAPPCSAQDRVEVTPFVGLYLASAVQQGTSPCLWICLTSSTAAIYQEDAPAVGARVTAWTSKRLALDVAVAHWRSDIQNTSTDMTTGSVGLLVTLGAPDSVSFSFLGGLSFVSLGGAAFSGSYPIGPTQTDWGPLVGVGIRIPFSPKLGLRVAIEDHLYTQTGWAASEHEHALILSAGLAIAVHRARHPSAERGG
jgi:hypothetical protein